MPVQCTKDVLSKANASSANGNEEADRTTNTTTTTPATSTTLSGVNSSHAEIIHPNEVEAEVPPACKLCSYLRT